MKRLFALVALLMVAKCSLAAVSGNQYLNTELSLSLAKPSNWYYMVAKSVHDNRSQLRLDSESATQEVAKESDTPAVVIAKYRNPQARKSLTPTVQILTNDIAKLVGITPTEQLTMAITPLQRGVANFKFIEETTETTIEGLPGAKVVFSYSLAIPNGQRFDVKSRLYIVHGVKYAYTIGMSGPASGEDVSDVEFQQIFESMKFELASVKK